MGPNLLKDGSQLHRVHINHGTKLGAVERLDQSRDGPLSWDKQHFAYYNAHQGGKYFCSHDTCMGG